MYYQLINFTMNSNFRYGIFLILYSNSILYIFRSTKYESVTMARVPPHHGDAWDELALCQNRMIR